MVDITIPPRHQIRIELRPYFDDEEVLMDLDDEELYKIYSEMKFLKYGLILPEDFEEV